MSASFDPVLSRIRPITHDDQLLYQAIARLAPVHRELVLRIVAALDPAASQPGPAAAARPRH